MAADETNAAPKKRGFKKLIIILSVVLVIILGVAGAGAYWLFFMPHAEDEEHAAAQSEPRRAPPTPPPAPPAPPVFVALDTFTVNLTPDATGERFLQIMISIEVINESAGKQLELYTPRIRNHVMKVLSSKTATELTPREGKEQLAVELRTLMNETLHPGWTPAKPGDAPDGAPVRDVLFTSFIIQ